MHGVRVDAMFGPGCSPRVVRVGVHVHWRMGVHYKHGLQRERLSRTGHRCRVGHIRVVHFTWNRKKKNDQK